MGLDNELKRLDVQMGPLKRQEMRARIEGIGFQNEGLRMQNKFTNETWDYNINQAKAKGTQAEIEVQQNEKILEESDRARQDLSSILELVSSEEYQGRRWQLLLRS